MEKYSEFKSVSLESTGLIRTNKLDFVYTCMLKNNISNLQELFNRVDEGTINYETTKGYAKYKYPANQVSGTVDLLRYKYLRTDLHFNDLLNSDIVHGEIIDDDKPIEYGILVYLTKMGLPYDFSVSLHMSAYNSSYCGKLIDFLVDFNMYRQYYVVCSTPEFENAIAKLNIIIDWYFKKINDISCIDDISQAKLKLRSLQNYLHELKIKETNINKEIADTTTQIREVEDVIARLLKK